MRRPTKTPSPEFLGSVRELYERGQTLDALRHAETFAPLREWGGVAPCICAARIAANVGAPRLSLRLAARAWHLDRANPETMAQYGYEIISRRGALAVWKFAGKAPLEREDWPAEGRADLLALKARAAIILRDFATAEPLLARAEQLSPTGPWVHLQRADFLEAQDRVPEALAVAEAACALHPQRAYRPGVQSRAHLLQVLDRDDDAINLLNESAKLLQSGPIAAQLYALLSENERWPEAEAALENYVALSPLLEPPLREWVNAQKARVAHRLGDRARAVQMAQQVDEPFFKAYAQELAQPAAERDRVQLPVTFVRQHFKTCAPATLAALARYWNTPAEHLKLVEAFCYDGTPHCTQREWAERNGWVVREFSVTQEITMALIERGVPFAISVVSANSGHMMAAIGFDRTRRTLLFRDPSQPYIVETPTEGFLEQTRPFGPHGMIFLPPAEAGRLEGLTLPDSELLDALHRLYLRLGAHDRDGALAALQEMEQAAPKNFLTWEGRLALASYDGNLLEEARCLDQLLELFPNAPARLLRRVNCLEAAAREERLRCLAPACRNPKADPALFVACARALVGDARRSQEARHWLRRALRRQPHDATAITTLADLCWSDGEVAEATELYRFAANLEGFREQLYQTWFIACRCTRRTQEAMAHLEDRYARFGHRSEQPALTLAWVWGELEAPKKALAILQEAIQEHPAQGYLLLRAASVATRLGESATADRCLAAAETKVRWNDWVRCKMEIAETRLDYAGLLKLARELLEREPLALDAHAAMVRAVTLREGVAAAVAHLEAACQRFPHHYGLRRMLTERLRVNNPPAFEQSARALLELAPSDAWARRELAIALVALNRHAEALAETEEAARYEPRNSYSHSIRGRILQRLQRPDEAQNAFRRAITLSVDNTDAIHSLLAAAGSDDQRKAALAFVERELIQQVVQGDGLLAFLDHARSILPPDALLQSMRLAHRERPDLWQSWSSLVSQLGHLNQLEDALSLAKQAAERFAHLPRTWLDLALVHRWRNEPEAEIAAARTAFDINPSWAPSARMLANALERQNRLPDARAIYERALQHLPLDAELHALHADVLWRQRQVEPALQSLERALRLVPDYGWAWNLFIDWAAQSGQADRPIKLARSLTTERPGDEHGWIALARVLTGSADAAERLAAAEQALRLDSQSVSIWDLKAELLGIGQRFDEAVQTCRAGLAACTADAYVLQGRLAWIDARRCRPGEAIKAMRLVLANHSSYGWGWHQLAAWLIDDGQFSEAADALTRLQRLRPHDPEVTRHLAYARLREGDRARACEAFSATLAAMPHDSFAAHSLFDLQLEVHQVKAAEATLRIMQTQQPGNGTLVKEIQLWLYHGNATEAANALVQLCASSDPDHSPFEQAISAFQKTGYRKKAMAVIVAASKKSACNPAAAQAMMQLMLAQQREVQAMLFLFRLGPGEAFCQAAAPMLQALGKSKETLLLFWLLWRRRDALYAHDETWGQVGYALSSLSRMKRAIAWLKDWETRRTAQPWMVFNLCFALRQTGNFPAATAVARQALAKWDVQEHAADLRLFLAVEEALAGEVDSADAHLKKTNLRADVPYDQQLSTIAKAMIEFWRAPLSQRREQFGAVRGELARNFATAGLLQCSYDVRRTFARAGRVMFDHGGAWPCWVFFKWRLYGPLFGILLALLVFLVMMLT